MINAMMQLGLKTVTGCRRIIPELLLLLMLCWWWWWLLLLCWRCVYGISRELASVVCVVGPTINGHMRSHNP